jgi:transcriptional regulator with PAS, ATPase and Fis domain
MRQARGENERLARALQADGLEHPEAFAAIVTASPSMHGIFRYVEAIASTPLPVLVTGETGVGKELIARAIHGLSGRTGAFVAVNAAGLDDTLFSDALFGHKRGGFTGADRDRPGLIEQAAGGTLFLDEIGDLAAASQVKLLRLLQEGRYYPIGSDVQKASDARVVVATNRDIAATSTTGCARTTCTSRRSAGARRICRCSWTTSSARPRRCSAGLAPRRRRSSSACWARTRSPATCASWRAW